jgi:Holliday junction DNA helicase RuvA
MVGEVGKNVLLYVNMIIREDSCQLYGFAEEAERECFRLLVSVSGVGARFALSILSVLAPDDIVKNIQLSNPEVFTMASGVGTKLAQKIVLELKGKVQKEMGSLSDSVFGSNLAEAINALVALGFSQTEAMQAAQSCDAKLPVEEIIRQGLKNLNSAKF